MSGKNQQPNMAATSDSDAAVLAMLGDEGAKDQVAKSATEAAAEDLSKGKGSPAPSEMAGPDGQDKANGDNKTCDVKKSDDDEEEDDDDDGEKGFTVDELRKSFETAMAVSDGSVADDSERRQELAGKLAKGMLSAEERTELQSLLSDPTVGDDGSEADPVLEGGEELQRSYAEMAVEDPALQKGGDDSEYAEEIDAAAFLQRFAAFVAGGLDEVNGSVQKGFARQQSFNKNLAKGMIGVADHIGKQSRVIEAQGKLIKSMGERIEHLERAPGQRRSVATKGQAEQLQRGFGPTGGGEELNQNELVKGLVNIGRKSADGRSETGHDITWATATVEGGGQIPQDLYNEVKKSLGR